MRIGLVQLNPIVGDIEGNTEKLQHAISSLDAEIILTTEMAICGYPPRDLLCDIEFVRACEQAVQSIACTTREEYVLLGHPRVDEVTGRIRNSVSVAHAGNVIAVSDKLLLPSYDVFDEKRYFEQGESICTFSAYGKTIGIATCEDFWQGNDAAVASAYDTDPMQQLIEAKCDVIVCPSASPFVAAKHNEHILYTRKLASKYGVTIAMCNQVGGNDDLIFDGGSFIANTDGIIGELPLFTEEAKSFSLDAQPIEPVLLSTYEELWHALVLGTRDYVMKTGHGSVLLGLSGGIDSAVVATIAVAALGGNAVHGVLMPSRFSSLGSIEDAERLAENLQIQTETLPIEHLHVAFERTLGDACLEQSDIAGENAQARLRGLLLMAVSNTNGSLLLATGNKSELAVGYSTLYGDMNGAISLIGDVYKTDVWALANWINANYEQCGFAAPPVPESSITKPPSAELRFGQTDQDSLPEYDVLDAVLRLHIDCGLGLEELQEAASSSSELHEKIVRMVDIAQFKRDQASVIFKTSPRTFGRGRRMPIVMKRAWSTSREMT
ncbi:MAG: NAD+ synthase [Phycisphaerae bacterium]|nr:NAD+ synthase [Phycisphaerae bacterium]